MPGFIFLLGFYPIYKTYIAGIYDIETIDFSYLVLLSVIAGGIYYYLGVNRILIRWSHRKIDNNILNGLISIYGTVDANQKKRLMENNTSLNIFYNIVDNDESLKRKVNNFYFNSLFWTSTADAILINMLFWITYKFIISSEHASPLFIQMLLCVIVLSIILHFISVYRQIKLTNEQINYIRTIYPGKVKTLVQAVLNPNP